MQRVLIVSRYAPKAPVYTIPSSFKVHERSKKGLAHSVKSAFLVMLLMSGWLILINLPGMDQRRQLLDQAAEAMSIL